MAVAGFAVFSRGAMDSAFEPLRQFRGVGRQLQQDVAERAAGALVVEVDRGRPGSGSRRRLSPIKAGTSACEMCNISNRDVRHRHP